MKKTFTLIASVMLLSIQAQTTLTTYADFTATDVHGNTHTISSYLNSGKYVFIDFFFTTCPPCIASVPYVNNVYTNYGSNSGDVIMIAVDNGDSNAEVLAYETTYGGLLPSISGVEGGGTGICSTYGIGAYPTFILIDPTGDIVEQDIWPASEAIISTIFDSYGISSSVGLDDSETGSIELFPNPASNKLHINAESDILEWEIFDILGQSSNGQSATVGSKSLDLDVSDLPEGIYTIRIVTAEGLFTLVFRKI
jgi:thiol-disulfide isomerase/thioredoxin